MDADLLTLLRTSKIFASLPRRALKKIIPHFERVELSKNEVLYYQGDPSGSIEIILNGELSSILTTATGETKQLNDIGPGETVGELGALSGEPRAATVKAKKDSVLFKLPSEIFLELCHQYPNVLFEIISPIISRSQKLVELISSEKFKKHIAIIPAHEGVRLDMFSEKLAEHTSELNSLVLLSEYNEFTPLETPDQIQAIIDDAKVRNTKKIKQRLLYILKPHETILSQFCFEKVEMIYIVGDEKEIASLNGFAKEKLLQFAALSKTKPELIILHSDDTVQPRNTLGWLELANFGLHHHIRLTHYKDYSRLIRFIRRKAVGIVLSGGGTRGWGQIGALKALIEAGIPIDAIGGTSVGAIVAANYAITESVPAALEQFREVIEGSRDSVSWRSITWPAISLFNARNVTIAIQKVFSDHQIEDLWIPYFCVTTNLAKNVETVHRRGTLWERIRGSIAIPGVVPPMLLGGELHIDGGLLNNLPVDCMREIIGQRGNVIAIELSGSAKDTRKYNFPPVLTFWQALLGKIGIVYDYTFPRFIDTFLKSLLVGSSLKSQQNCTAADIYISLDLSRYPMLHSNKKQVDGIIELGYEATMLKIKDTHKKSSS